MNSLKWLIAGVAAGIILVAFRDLENDRWLLPDRNAFDGSLPDAETEPVLGYDGMDQETLLDWLDDAELDRHTLLQIRRYEATHRGREPVLSAVADLLD